jgi:hypothetical protein
MKTMTISLIITFAFVFFVPVANAESMDGWGPVHEQRKAWSEKNKKVYGPKTTNTEETSTDQASSAAKEKAKVQDSGQGATKGAKTVGSQGVQRSQVGGVSRKKDIPPPSKALQKMKKKKTQAKKVSPPLPPAKPDVVGTVVPVVPHPDQGVVNPSH